MMNSVGVTFGVTLKKVIKLLPKSMTFQIRHMRLSMRFYQYAGGVLFSIYFQQ